MSHARRLEGPRAPLFITLAIATGFAGAPLHAQSVDRADLQRCADMSTAERKLACFESLLDNPPSAAVLPAAPPPPADAVPALEKAAAATTEPVQDPVTESAPEPLTTAQPADDFGDEYVKESAEDDDDQREDVTATVNKVTLDRYKRLRFEFANGQVWRQLEARRFPYPNDEPFDVVISRGVFGDYQLRVGGEGRMTRIKRLK